MISNVVPHLLWGALVTAELVMLSAIGVVALGLLVALAKLSRWRLIRLPAALYVDIARAIPLLVQLFLIVFALPDIGLKLPLFWACILGLVLYYGAYEAEICRSGILAIDKGQIEAAVALGMRPVQVLRRITLRQALRVALPPTGSLFIGALKGSAQVAVVGLPDLLRTANNFTLSTGNVMPIYLIVSGIYLAMTYLLSYGVAFLERSMRIHD